MIELVKTVAKYRIDVIFTIVVVVALVLISYFKIVPWMNEEIARVFRTPPASAVPEMLNMTIENNETVSKRIKLNLGDEVTLLNATSDLPPGLDKNINFVFNNNTRTSEYFVYVIADNSNYIFPQGHFEGIIRFYYSNSEKVLNKPVLLDVTVIKSQR